MPDVFSKRKRSAVMSAIRSRGNAATELSLLALFRAHGFTGWRRGATLRRKGEGPRLKAFRVKPDFVFRPHRVTVFVDGWFWPGCPLHATQPKTNAAFWRKFAVVWSGLRRDRPRACQSLPVVARSPSGDTVLSSDD